MCLRQIAFFQITLYAGSYFNKLLGTHAADVFSVDVDVFGHYRLDFNHRQDGFGRLVVKKEYDQCCGYGQNDHSHGYAVCTGRYAAYGIDYVVVFSGYCPAGFYFSLQ